MMDKHQETFETWNKIAQLYEEKFMDLDLYNHTYDQFCDAIKSDRASILDIGCGPGNITRYLLRKRPDLHIEGIDLAPNMIELARKNNPTASFSVSDVRNLHLRNKKTEGIICGFCLPFLSAPECKKLFSDSCKLLHENGVFYLSFVPGNPASSGFISGSSGDRVFFNYHDPDTLMNELTETGFEITQTENIEFLKLNGATETHTILISRKKTEKI
jgi:2-polyprenyl-3-methyl-5-hydroxy-6-metoxy-1,4-benzoquinol methylase